MVQFSQVKESLSRKPTYPENHKPGMKVPKGGSMCKNCEYLVSPDRCRNKYFIKWNGSNKIPGEIDSYCSDWYEPNA
jgi:hypothetical protein